MIRLLVLCVLLFTNLLSAQWISDPSINTKLVQDTFSPINVSAVTDGSGGFFIFWEDAKFKAARSVYFIHVNPDGSVSLRADGKEISSALTLKHNPKSYPYLQSSALTVWLDVELNKNPILYAQMVSAKGDLLWGEIGKQISPLSVECVDYSISADNNNNVFIPFITKEKGLTGDYYVAIAKLDKNGKSLFDSDFAIVNSSNNRKSMPVAAPEGSGGAFVFWLENINGISTLNFQFVNPDGKISTGKKSEILSSKQHSVFEYDALSLNSSSAFVTWESGKKIFYQVIDKNGKEKISLKNNYLSSRQNKQSYPRILSLDSAIVVSWIEEEKFKKNIFAQRFDLKGNKLWAADGVPVIVQKGNQFGQKMIDDKKGGVIVSWIDKRIDTSYANIYSQRFDPFGNKLWDSTGTVIANSPDAIKSYLNLVPDGFGGGYVIYTQKQNNKTEIFGQRIFNDGSYVSHIVGLNAQVLNDSIKVSWYSTTNLSNSYFLIEKKSSSDSLKQNWIKVDSIPAVEGKEAYEYYDVHKLKPESFYRVTQFDFSGKFLTSELTGVHKVINSSLIVLHQNNPNPFADSTVIGFELPKEETVSIEFFNGKLEKVGHLLNKKFPAGKNYISFSAFGLPEGVYFYSLKTQKVRLVKKMVIAR